MIFRSKIYFKFKLKLSLIHTKDLTVRYTEIQKIIRKDFEIFKNLNIVKH